MINLLDDAAYHGLLTRSQAILLRHIMDAGKPVLKTDLADALWAHREDGGGLDKTIDVFISQIRKKLRPGFQIEAEYGIGYRLTVDPDVLSRHLAVRMAEALAA